MFNIKGPSPDGSVAETLFSFIKFEEVIKPRRMKIRPQNFNFSSLFSVFFFRV